MWAQENKNKHTKHNRNTQPLVNKRSSKNGGVITYSHKLTNGFTEFMLIIERAIQGYFIPSKIILLF